jgi:enamine deaminase RidA (YjgF/YER057c/UK114 family)
LWEFKAVSALEVNKVLLTVTAALLFFAAKKLSADVSSIHSYSYSCSKTPKCVQVCMSYYESRTSANSCASTKIANCKDSKFELMFDYYKLIGCIIERYPKMKLYQQNAEKRME